MSLKIKSAEKSKNTKIETCEGVDEYVRLKIEIASLEAKAQVISSQIEATALAIYAENAMKLSPSNIKLQGEEYTCNYLVIDKSSAIKKEEHIALVEKYGKDTVDLLVEVDFLSFRLNPEVMQNESFRKEVISALEKLEKKIGSEVLLPGTFSAKKGIQEKIKTVAKSSKSFIDILQDFKITKYLKK